MRNRFHATSEEIAHKLEHAYGHYSEAYQRVVKYSTDEEIYDFQLNHGFTEDMLAYCAAFCRMQSLHGRNPVYFYRLERELPGDDAGAFHASEHWYVFRTLDHCWRPLTEMIISWQKLSAITGLILSKMVIRTEVRYQYGRPMTVPHQHIWRWMFSHICSHRLPMKQLTSGSNTIVVNSCRSM